MTIGRYRTLEDFDAYICGVGRIQVGKGAEFELRVHPPNAGIPKTYDVYFLNSKNYLPFDAVATFLSVKTERIVDYGRDSSTRETDYER